jgi:hypothetical protein
MITGYLCSFNDAMSSFRVESLDFEIDCIGSWGQYGSCDRSCGAGSQIRTYTVTNQAQYGGDACEAAHGATKSQSCNQDIKCPTCDPAELSEYTLLKSVAIPASNGNWDTAAQVPYTNDNAMPAYINRVAYCMRLGDEWVWTSFDETDTSKVGVPTDFQFDGSVPNMHVYSTNTGITERTGSGNTGKLEFWAHSYHPGADGVFNHDDNRRHDNRYGSMQVHDGTSTVLAFNGWSHGSLCDVSIGPGFSHPDGTFNNNCGSYNGDGKSEVMVYVKESPPVNCGGSWGQYGSCDRSCGAGSQTRTYTVTTQAQYGGETCEAAHGATESKSCTDAPCPIHCVGDFGNWDTCTKTCASGSQTRTFDIAIDAEHGGNFCEHQQDHAEEQMCNDDIECPEPVDVELTVAETVESFTPAKQASLIAQVAAQLGVDPSAITIQVGRKANPVTNSPYDRRLSEGLLVTFTIEVLPSQVAQEIEKLESPSFAVATGATFKQFKPVAGSTICATCKWIEDTSATGAGYVKVTHFTNSQGTNEQGLQHKCYHADGACTCKCDESAFTPENSSFFRDGAALNGRITTNGPAYGTGGLNWDGLLDVDGN